MQNEAAQLFQAICDAAEARDPGLGTGRVMVDHRGYKMLKAIVAAELGDEEAKAKALKRVTKWAAKHRLAPRPQIVH